MYYYMLCIPVDMPMWLLLYVTYNIMCNGFGFLGVTDYPGSVC